MTDEQEAVVMQAFERWWNEEGSRTEYWLNAKEHCYRTAKIAWSNGAYKAFEQQPDEEPVAVDVRCPDCGGSGVDAKDNNYGCIKCGGSGFVERIFHTRPQPAAWVGLTNNEIETIAPDVYGSFHYDDYKFARAIEAKLREKNT